MNRTVDCTQTITESVTLRENHLLWKFPVSQFKSIHCFSVLCICLQLCCSSCFIMCVDMWTLEGLDKAQNCGVCFHPQQSEASCRSLIWQLKGLVHQNHWKITYLSLAEFWAYLQIYSSVCLNFFPSHAFATIEVLCLRENSPFKTVNTRQHLWKEVMVELNFFKSNQT